MDQNLDLLKSNSHTDTNEFLNINLQQSLAPMCLIPSRITEFTSTLIDNIFTSFNPLNSVSYVLLSDISDHFPVILFAGKSNKTNTTEKYKKVTTRPLHESSINAIITDLIT